MPHKATPRTKSSASILLSFGAALVSALCAGKSAGSAVIRCKRGIAFDHGEALDRYTEFFGRGLAISGGESSADIHFAGVDGDRSIGVDGDEAIHVGRIQRFRCIAAGLSQCEAHNQRACGHFQDSAAG